MLPRERMLLCLDHKDTDRPPLDLGSTPNTTMTKLAYESLLGYLGMDSDPPVRLMRKALQIVEIDEAVLQRLQIDTRGINMNPCDEKTFKVISDDVYQDEWGIVIRAARSNGQLLYYDIVTNPLRNASSPREVEHYAWPSPYGDRLAAGLGAEARRMRETTPYALVGHIQGIFELCWYLRGMDVYFTDLLKKKNMVHAIMEKVYEIQADKMIHFLDQVGPYLDVVSTADDLGGEDHPLISPKLYREMIKPYHKKYYAEIKSRTDAKLMMHSCGSTAAFFDDFLDMGFEIINPVQVTAGEMDPRKLKNRYGHLLSFWGGIDSQRLLPKGSEQEVRKTVLDLIDILGAGGGYVPCTVHNIQFDVPPQNVMALYDTVLNCR